jgi:hypothetical protein
MVALHKGMKERRKSLPPKLRQVSESIAQALDEAKKIREISVQEEVVLELDKVNDALERAKKAISGIMKT